MQYAIVINLATGFQLKLKEEEISTQKWADLIRSAYSRTVENVIVMGKLLIGAKKTLPHGDFLKMIQSDLPFGARTAERLMEIASNRVLMNSTHESDLPASWTTLHLLTKIPDETLVAKLKDGTINPKITRAQVKALLPARTKPHKPKSPKPECSGALESSEIGGRLEILCGQLFDQLSPMSELVDGIRLRSNASSSTKNELHFLVQHADELHYRLHLIEENIKGIRLDLLAGPDEVAARLKALRSEAPDEESDDETVELDAGDDERFDKALDVTPPATCVG